ncbi:hypothetical protein INR49_031196 [Caranx melampygus]|nr:hypothetical protein INR49_031196 [Caranx melampygus]
MCCVFLPAAGNKPRSSSILCGFSMTLQGPESQNLHSGINSNAPGSGQDPRLHGNNQDLGPSPHPQHHASARPFFYLHAPPPLPFLQYQWPMPFSYNPFNGFPGMGYGMVMPPFPPPPPYMEPPSYILPHPHVQAVDYRRLLHPQAHAPSAPYQNPNQTRRVRPPHAAPVRQMVNSEVQTEPTHRGIGGYHGGSITVSSDSGHGTASNSPSSSSSSQKGGSTEVENTEDFQVERTSSSSTVKHGFNILGPKGTKAVQSPITATQEAQKSRKDSIGQENIPPCRSRHCNVWSASSPDSMVPVCSSSQQEDEVVRERRVSIPDILMSWGGGTPQETMLKTADKVLSQKDEPQLLSPEKCVHQSPAGTQKDQMVADANEDAEDILSSKDGVNAVEILKQPALCESKGDDEPVETDSVSQCLPHNEDLLHSLNKSHKLPDNEQTDGNETNLLDDTTDIIPYQMPSRKMNESVWSVESLAPFIPTKEWLLQNGMFEPEVIIEMVEEAESCQHVAQNGNPSVKAGRQTCGVSSSDLVLMSDSWLDFSIPGEKQSLPKKPEMESEILSEIGGLKEGQNTSPSEKDCSASPTCLQSKTISCSTTSEGVDENGSSEPKANRSLNQESLIIDEQQANSPGSSEEHAPLFLSSVAGQTVSSMKHPTVQNKVDNRTLGNDKVRNEQLCVPKADQKICEASPLKGPLVDSGVQCTEIACFCKELNNMKRGNNGNAEGTCMNGHQRNQKRQSQWKNRGSEKHNNQQEVYNGFPSKPGKSKGGNGRNPRY